MNAPILARRVAAIVPCQARSRLSSPGRLALVATLGASIALSAASFAMTKVAVRLEGDIASECAVIGAAAMDLGEISTPGRKDYGFTVNCNTPFEYRLEAKYGALTNTDGTTSTGFAKSVPYDVAIYIPTDGAAIDDRCSGESIRFGRVHCRFGNSGDRIALESRGNLTLAWTPQGIPLAGRYTDRLTITVAIRQ